MRKYKYKDRETEYPYRVIASYQPAYMDSPADDRVTFHKTMEKALRHVEKIEDEGYATDITLLHVEKVRVCK
jgi:hypothetical protein